ncbi:MAG: hypothetical protein M2R45_05417 [Verrucomicrobia subdivision 3 bacterium]|nr:hypothetical protein [Limisphaerales bacterium]MCS1417866.1 hypothetical protein [Limisphaerales bacterium]
MPSSLPGESPALPGLLNRHGRVQPEGLPLRPTKQAIVCSRGRRRCSPRIRFRELSLLGDPFPALPRRASEPFRGGEVSRAVGPAFAGWHAPFMERTLGGLFRRLFSAPALLQQGKGAACANAVRGGTPRMPAWRDPFGWFALFRARALRTGPMGGDSAAFGRACYPRMLPPERLPALSLLVFQSLFELNFVPFPGEDGKAPNEQTKRHF